MAVTISTSPIYPGAGQPVTLVGAADAGEDSATQWELTSVPDGCDLALGRIVERHPNVVRETASFTFQAETTKAPAFIARTEGTFAPFVPGMLVDITGTTSNNRRVTVAATEPLKLTLSADDALTTETATSTLTGAFFGRSGGFADTITFPIPGEYGVTASEIFITSGAGGSYAGDPMGVTQSRLLGRTTATIHVGGFVELPIKVVAGHSATLRLLVVNDTVRGAELVDFRSDIARLAALDTTVAAAVTALVGVAVNNLDADFVTTVTLGVNAYEGHRVLTGAGPAHFVADNVNAMLRQQAWSIPTTIARLNEWAAKMTAHQMGGNAALAAWHDEDDSKNTLQVAPTAATLGEAVVLLADLRNRVYRRHYVQVDDPDSHRAADGINTLGAPTSGTLSFAIVAYLDFVASAISAAAGEGEGLADAQSAWGFRAA